MASNLASPEGSAHQTRQPQQPREGYTASRRGRGGAETQRGWGRGRGQKHSTSNNRPAPPQPPEASSTPVSATQDAVDAPEEGETLARVPTNATDSDAEVCFICASPVVHNSVAPCNHRTCHICALRLRALYKNKACAHCRTQADCVIFTDDPAKRYEDFKEEDFFKVDENLGIKYEKDAIFDDTVLLLRYNCPDSTCDVACRGWPDLHRHVRGVHHKVMCDLCSRNKKVFTHEHELFTGKELHRHEKLGDDNPGAVDQSGFKGHPECGFCRQRFYGDDELYTHCRDKHERCHICDRRNGGRQPQYYLDYPALEAHFSKDHFLCLDQECLDKKFIVFESEMDLKAHQLQTHPDGLSKDARRDARRVDMSDFDYRAPHQQTRGGRRDGRNDREGRGRGRDPNAEPLPPSTAQPMRRDEIAYQRQLAIHSAQSVTTRTFGGQLTSLGNGPSASQQSTKANISRTANLHASANNVGVNGSSALAPCTTADQALTPQEQARKLRHNAVNERAGNLLHNDGTKMNEFRAKVSAYRSSSMTAAELIDSFFALFDSPSAELGKLVKELAELFEISQKRDDLLRAWNDWRAINEDYPSLPGPDGLPAGASSISIGGGGKRILKLKSSTAQSSRSAVSRQGSWGSASQAGGLFPPLPAAGKSQSTKPGMSWATSRPAASSNNIATGRAAFTSAPGPSSTADLFPALPAAQKPSMNAVRPGFMGNLTKRESGTSTPINAWSRDAASDGEIAAAVAASLNDDMVAAGKRKGKKKQTLYHWG